MTFFQLISDLFSRSKRTTTLGFVYFIVVMVLGIIFLNVMPKEFMTREILVEVLRFFEISIMGLLAGKIASDRFGNKGDAK